MAIRSERAPKSATARETPLIGPSPPAPAEAISVVDAGLGETAPNFTFAVARFSLSPSEVKFWTIWVVPPKSTTAIKRSGEAIFSTNWFAARRAHIWSEVGMVESSKKITI